MQQLKPTHTGKPVSKATLSNIFEWSMSKSISSNKISTPSFNKIFAISL